MNETVLWIAGGGTALVVAGLLIGFVAWLRFLDDDAERSRDNKHRCHHKWSGE